MTKWGLGTGVGMHAQSLSQLESSSVCCHCLLQGIFLTQRLNPCLLHWQVDSLPPGHLGAGLMWQQKQGKAQSVGGRFPFLRTPFLSNTISRGSKAHVSASSLLLPPWPDQHLEDALKESSISLLYILIELLDSNKFQTKSISKIFFECLLWLELHVVRVGVRWGGDQVFVGEDTMFWCFGLVFRSSWVSWTMKRKCPLS